MEPLTQMFAVIAVFAMVHERVLELLRVPRKLLAEQDQDQPEDKKRWTRAVTVLDALTIGSFNWVSGVALALLTHADLLALMRPDENGKMFFELYMPKDPWGWGLVHFIGCVLMGFSTTVGSKFWHDAVNTLMDFRKQLKGVGAAARGLTESKEPQALNPAADEAASRQGRANAA